MARRMVIIVIIKIIFLLFVFSNDPLRGQEKEDLLFEKIPVVITASRKEQPITQSPSTITVVTAEDISMSGAVNIPDVLRSVAGVDVMSISLRDQQVSVRGFNDSQSNKLLVMIDGRSVYTELYGSVLWEMFPISLMEIERIEIVKSPVSSLYGANAFCGVVNIITRTPEKWQGTTLKLTGGTGNTIKGALFHSGGGKTVGYKLSGEFDRADEWNDTEKTGDIYRINAALYIKTGDKSKLALQAGRAVTMGRSIYGGPELSNLVAEGHIDYFQVDYKFGDFSLRTFYNVLDTDLDFGDIGGKQFAYNSTHDFELTHSFRIGKTHSVVWGANYRANHIKGNNFLKQNYTQHHWAIFFEDQIKLSPQLRLTFGGRYDKHPLVGEHFSPRGSLFLSLSDIHIFRFSIARAFRNPAFLNSYLDINFSTPLPEPSIAANLPFFYSITGNPDLKSEGILAYEIGYLLTGIEGLELNINLFYNNYYDLFGFSENIFYYGPGELYPGSPGGVYPKGINRSFRNIGGAWGVGGEIDLHFKINDRLSGFVNYSYVKITRRKDNPDTELLDESQQAWEKFPRNKINAGLRFHLNRCLHVNINGNWVDSTAHYINAMDGNEYIEPLNDYMTFDATILYRVNNLEFSLAVYNLFNNRHLEFPSGPDPSVAFSQVTGSRVYLGVRFDLTGESGNGK